MGVVLEIVVPSIATVLTNALFLSPIPEAIRVQETKSLGFFNPIPYPFMIFNCLSWILYGLTFDSPSTSLFIFFGNFSGVVTGVYCSLVCLPLAAPDLQLYIQISIVILTLAFFPLIYFLVFFLSGPSIHLAFGCVSIIAAFVFFASPLSTLREIIQSKSAKSIYWPLTLTSGVSTLLWTIYGIVLQDWLIITPNGFATILSGVQLILLWYYGHGVQEQKEHQDSVVVDLREEEMES